MFVLEQFGTLDGTATIAGCDKKPPKSDTLKE